MAERPKKSSGTNRKARDAESTVQVLRVVAQREGFRRAGRPWTRAETVVPVEDLTAEQVEALQAEPRLKVTEDEVPASEVR